MQNFLSQLSSAGLAQQMPMIPELPPGPSLDRLRGPVEIDLLETWQIALIAILGILAIALISRWGFNYFKPYEKQTTSLPPRDAAIAELNVAIKLAASDDQRFAVLCSQTLRRYFEAGKGINTLGKTTDEFLKNLETCDLLNSHAHSLLADLLSHCDKVKFAGKSLSEADRQKLIRNAFELIETCEQASDIAVVNSVNS